MPPMRVRRLVFFVAVLAALGAAVPGCSKESTTPPQALTGRIDPATAPVRVGRVEVVQTIPHSVSSWTEGLVLDGGKLYESTGQVGMSMLYEIDPGTGTITRRAPLPTNLYGEGLAKVGNEFVQLTWKDGKALVWNASTFQQSGSHSYKGEGWGLCYDGHRLVMSNGSSSLTFRNAKTFESTGQVKVTLDGEPVPQLNELECVNGKVYANVWHSDRIVVIEPTSGKVTELIDASDLLTPQERVGTDVLNGIAYDPASHTFWLTGKLWPHLFRVRIVPATGPLPSAPTTTR